MNSRIQLSQMRIIAMLSTAIIFCIICHISKSLRVHEEYLTTTFGISMSIWHAHELLLVLL